MADETTIGWTDHTHNNGWGCEQISPGCAHCYAKALALMYGYDVWGADNARRIFGEEHWKKPLKWNKQAETEGRRHKVFCSSMCDIFEDHPTIIGELKKLWPLIKNTPWLDWQLLTKRADRIAPNLPSDWHPELYKNVWMGVSIENDRFVHRADHLRAIPAKVRFLSLEPLLGPLPSLNLEGIHWVIVGGESGHHFRPMDEGWVRDIREKCDKAGVAFFFKQQAHRYPSRNAHIDGVEVKNFPLPILGQ